MFMEIMCLLSHMKHYFGAGPLGYHLKTGWKEMISKSILKLCQYLSVLYLVLRQYLFLWLQWINPPQRLSRFGGRVIFLRWVMYCGPITEYLRQQDAHTHNAQRVRGLSAQTALWKGNHMYDRFGSVSPGLGIKYDFENVERANIQNDSDYGVNAEISAVGLYFLRR